MKKLFLYNTRFYILVIAVLLSSCGKKSSDNPQPAPATNSTSGNSKLEAPATRPEKVPGASGTVRETPVDISVPAGTTVKVVEVGVHTEMRANMNDNNAADLNKILGNQNLRLEGLNANNTFGWRVDDILLNDSLYTGLEVLKSINMDKVYFFNIDAPGVYYIYDYQSNNWLYGTWAVDDSMQYVAFNVEADGKFSNLWTLSGVTEYRMVLSIRKDLDGDSIIDNLSIGLNAYEPNSSQYTGEDHVSDTQKDFIGTWSYSMSINSSGNSQSDSTIIVIDKSGVGYVAKLTSNGTFTEQYYTWSMEVIPDSSSSSSQAFVYMNYSVNDITYYEKYYISLENQTLTFVFIDTDNNAYLGDVGTSAIAKKH